MNRFLKACLTLIMVAVFLTCSSVSAEAPETQEVTLNSSSDEIQSANILFAGDLLCLAGQLSAAHKGNSWDFSYVFSKVAPIIKKADFAVANLETPVAGAAAGVTAYNQQGNPILNAPIEFLDACTAAGFDMFSTANNHAYDKGSFGIKSTIKELNARGIYHSGTYTSEYMQENTPVVDVNGIKIAVLSYTKYINQRHQMKSSEGYMINNLDYDLIRRDIENVRSRNADLVFLFVHWGTENTNNASKSQKEEAKILANLGADAIIGSHSHTVQPAEYVKTDDGREVFVIYSMGNFVSSMARDINKDALLLNIYAEKKNGVAEIKEISYMCTTTAPLNGKLYAILPSRIAITDKINPNTMKGSINRTTALLTVIKEVDCFDYAK